MTKCAGTSVEDKPTIDADDVRVVTFRPDRPGHVGIWSEPQPHPLAPLRGEPYVLGRVTLRRPGLNEPLATYAVPISAQAMTLTYDATRADLDASSGPWTCEILNGTNGPVLFDTLITYVSDRALRTTQTAWFDIGLLDLIVGKAVAVAGARLRLRTSPPLLSAAIATDDRQGAACVTQRN